MQHSTGSPSASSRTAADNHSAQSTSKSHYHSTMATSTQTLPNMPKPSAYTPPTASSPAYQQTPIYTYTTAPQPQSTASSFRLLNWAERKTRQANERQLERRVAQAASEGATVLRATEDPREPSYLAQRRERLFGNVQGEYYAPVDEKSEEWVSGGLQRKV